MLIERFVRGVCRPALLAGVMVSMLVASASGIERAGASGRATAVGSPQPESGEAWLDWFVGEWETTTRLHGFGDEPAESTGTARFFWQIPGRWLAQEIRTEVMGTPLHGFGLQGYDAMTGQFDGSYVDNVTPGIVLTRGTLDAAGAVLKQFGEAIESRGMANAEPTRYVTRIEGDHRFVFEVSEFRGGEYGLTVEIEYRRKGSPDQPSLEPAAFLGAWELDTEATGESLDAMASEMLRAQVASGELTEEQYALAMEMVRQQFAGQLAEARMRVTFHADGTLAIDASMFDNDLSDSRGTWSIADGRLRMIDADGVAAEGTVEGGRLRLRVSGDPGFADSFAFVLKRPGGAARDAYLGDWRIDEDATRAALLPVFTRAKGEPGSFADQFDGTPEELCDFFIQGAQARFTIKPDGTYSVVSSGMAWANHPKQGPWEYRGGYAVLDDGESNPVRIEIKGDRIHLTPMNEPDMPEGVVIILERLGG
ncbi:MAG: DUF1579 family protein [Phycisphaerales bacterium JB037]